METQSVRS